MLKILEQFSVPELTSLLGDLTAHRLLGAANALLRGKLLLLGKLLAHELLRLLLN